MDKVLHGVAKMFYGCGQRVATDLKVNDSQGRIVEEWAGDNKSDMPAHNHHHHSPRALLPRVNMND